MAEQPASSSPDRPKGAPANAPLSTGAPAEQPVRDEAFVHELNELLVSTFHSIERYEEQSLRSFEGIDLSVNEAHVIEAVGHATVDPASPDDEPADAPSDAAPHPAHRPQALTVSQVAASLGVRTPTATAAVNRLVAKGLLVKERSEVDARSVLVRLTRAGRRAFRLHDLFHRRMADAVAGDMTPEERRVLTMGIKKLKAFFENAANGDAAGRAVVHNSAPSAADTPAAAPAADARCGNDETKG